MLNFKSDIFILLFLFPLLSIAQPSTTDSIHHKYVSEKNDSLKILYHLKYISILMNNGRQKETETQITLAKKELEKFPVVSLLPVLFYYEGSLKYDQANYLQSIISLENSVKNFSS